MTKPFAMRKTSCLLLFVVGIASTQLSGQVLTLGTQVQDDVCDYGSGCINAYAIGGTAPYSFFWSPVPPTGQGTQQACGLFAGSYSITVFDSNGDSQTIEATVNSTPNLLFDTTPSDAIACVDPCNGYWSRSVSMGGVAPYTITVDPPAGAANANPNGEELLIESEKEGVLIPAERAEAFFAGYFSVRQLTDEEHAAVAPFLTIRRVWLMGAFAREDGLVGHTFMGSI